MPQLDKVTFLSQFFWLCIVFAGLYLILVKYLLPSFARIIKVRNFLAAANSADSSSESEEVKNEPTVYGNSLEASIQSFQKRSDFLRQWSSKKFKKVLPKLAPKFEKNLLTIRQENLLAESLLVTVLPPVDSQNQFQDTTHKNWFNAKVSNYINNGLKESKQKVASENSEKTASKKAKGKGNKGKKN